MSLKDEKELGEAVFKAIQSSWGNWEHVDHYKDFKDYCRMIYETVESSKSSVAPSVSDGCFPPPWSIYEHPEKTEGWIAFQKAMREDPKYYRAWEKQDE